ncbi:MAG: hypothetical protein V7607_6465 [Solirubrobacteraceae bacterium]
MARKVWVLDTETKGTGAQMVPLDKVLRKPGSSEPLAVHVPPTREPRAPKEPEPKPPRSFRIVDVTTGDVLGEHLDTRAAIAALEDVGSVVDVRIYVWDHRNERWVLLTLGEQKALWEFRNRGDHPTS